MKTIGSLGIGMVMGATLTGMYFMMPKMKKLSSPYTSDKYNAKDK